MRVVIEVKNGVATTRNRSDGSGQVAPKPGTDETRCRNTIESYVWSGFEQLRQSLFLRCDRPTNHSGAHQCVLPKEAGVDAGKLFAWPHDDGSADAERWIEMRNEFVAELQRRACVGDST